MFRMWLLVQKMVSVAVGRCKVKRGLAETPSSLGPSWLVLYVENIDRAESSVSGSHNNVEAEAHRSDDVTKPKRIESICWE